MVKKRLHSNVESVRKIEEIVREIAEELNLPSERYGDIYISLLEAVTNAIKHGNGEDERKFVQLEIEKASTSVAFRITDEGEGFDYEKLPNPTSDEHLHQLNGRGVFLMKELSDECSFCNRGRTVVLTFKI